MWNFFCKNCLINNAFAPHSVISGVFSICGCNQIFVIGSQSAEATYLKPCLPNLPCKRIFIFSSFNSTISNNASNSSVFLLEKFNIYINKVKTELFIVCIQFAFCYFQYKHKIYSHFPPLIYQKKLPSSSSRASQRISRKSC